MSRRGRVGSRRAVTYLITPVMTSRVTWRSNTRVAIMMMTLVRNDDDDDDDDDNASDNAAAAAADCDIYTAGRKTVVSNFK